MDNHHADKIYFPSDILWKHKRRTCMHSAVTADTSQQIRTCLQIPCWKLWDLKMRNKVLIL